MDDGTRDGRRWRRSMNKRKIVLLLLTLALIASASIQPAIAYFTTYVRARGGYPVSIGDTTTIEESFSDWTKRVTIRNKAGSEPVYIRAKAIYTPLAEGTALTISGEGWSDGGDGYWYYGSKAAPTILPGDATLTEAQRATSVLNVKIEKIPQEPKKGDTFSVTVIYESTPVRYRQDSNGNNVAYANWDATIERVSSTTGGNGQ